MKKVLALAFVVSILCSCGQKKQGSEYEYTCKPEISQANIGVASQFTPEEIEYIVMEKKMTAAAIRENMRVDLEANGSIDINRVFESYNKGDLK